MTSPSPAPSFVRLAIDLARLPVDAHAGPRLRAPLRSRRQVLRRRPGAARGLARGDRPRRSASARSRPRHRGARRAAEGAQRAARRAGAARPARRSPQPSPSSPDSRPASSAGRSTRCSRRSPRSSWRSGSSSSTRCRPCRSSGSTRRITTGTKWRGCTILDADLNSARCSSPRSGGAGERPVARVAARRGHRTVALDRAEVRALRRPSSPHKCSPARQGLRARRGMTHAFGAWIETLLGPLGLVVFDSADPAAKPLVGAALRERADVARAARRALAAEAGAAHAGARLSRPGHALAGQRRAVPSQRRREPIKHGDGGLVDRRAHRRRRRAHRGSDERARTFQPERPAAAARPGHAVSRPSPTSRGPSELAYLGQLQGRLRAFRRADAAGLSRARSATLLDSGGGAVPGEYDVPLEALQPHDEARSIDCSNRSCRARSKQALAQPQQAVEERMAAVIAVVPAIDPTLEGAAKSTLGKMTHELTALHNKVIQAAKRRDETLRRQFIRAQAQAFPDGTPAGTGHRLHHTPEPLRPRPHRHPGTRAAARPGSTG